MLENNVSGGRKSNNKDWAKEEHEKGGKKTGIWRTRTQSQTGG